MKSTFVLVLALCIALLPKTQAQTTVSSLAELRVAVQNSDQYIILTAGDYNIEDLPSNERFFDCTGSNNTIDLTDVYIDFPVGSSEEAHFQVNGDNNIIKGGLFENTYDNGMTDVTDFEAYNNDRNNLAYGADPHIKIFSTADGTTVIGTKMIVRGSFPYGYGSLFGIGAGSSFGLDKRAGIQINGPNTTVDSCEVQMQVFGHGIFIGEPATNTLIKNSLVEGVVRATNDILAEGTNSLPAQNGYKDSDGNDIQPDEVVSLCEDGIRVYSGGGDCRVENCTVKKMRGGIKLYLASGSSVINSTSIDCGDINYNMSRDGVIENSIGNFTYGEMSDFAGNNRSGYDAEWTILPLPNAVGVHNIMDIKENDHNIVFHRAPGPLDSDEERAIVVTGSNSNILNETEYTIILESSATGNTITTCGPVIDNGSINTILPMADCESDLTTICQHTASIIQAECFDAKFGTVISEGANIGFIKNDDWTAYSNIDLSQMNSVEINGSSKSDGGTVEFRLDSPTGELIASLDIPNTGNWNNYELSSTNISRVIGTHDLYLVYIGSGSYLLNLDWISFSEDVICDGNLDRIEAECYDSMSGIQTEDCAEGSLNIGYIHNGDWTSYSDIDLTNINSFKARVSAPTSDSNIEIRLDSIDGQLIGNLAITDTDGWQTWITDSLNVQSSTGVHDVYLVFTGGNGYLFNVNWVSFSEEILDELCPDYITNIDNTEQFNSLTADIQLESNDIIPAGANVAFTGGQSVILMPSFEVVPSATFHAYIDGCQIIVSSISELLEYVDKSNVEVKMLPGTYTIGASDVASGLIDGDDQRVIEFTGSNSTFDFTGVTFRFNTDLYRLETDDYNWGRNGVNEFVVMGNNNVYKNLTIIEFGNVQPWGTALAVYLAGVENLMEGFSVTTSGSFPYGYGDMFGKGSGSIIRHNKHSGYLIHGDRNHLKNSNLYMHTYGHGIFFGGTNGVTIEGCYVEGQLNTTDAVLAEAGSGSAADIVDFMTVFGYTVPPGWKFSCQEDGIRAYANSGHYLTGETSDTRGTTIIKDCTVKNMRSGVTIGLQRSGSKYIENTTVLGCEIGFWGGDDATFVNCRGDAAVGPLYSEDIERSNNVMDFTLLDNSTPRYGNTALLHIGGNSHNLTLKDGTTSIDPNLKILVGGTRYHHRFTGGQTRDCHNATIVNQTGNDVIIGSGSDGNDVTSSSPIIDNGSNNTISELE